MFRAIPTNNRICFDKDLKRNWKIHEQKVKEIRSTLNQSRPQQYAFLDKRMKRAALQEVRNIEIDKQNSCLFQKIKSMERKKSKTKKGKSCEQNNMKKTLNEPFRKRQLVKIVEENQELLKRIQMKKSMYNVKKWEKERKDIQKNITLISQYPYKNYPSTQTKVNFWMTDQDFSKKSTSRVRGREASQSKPKFTYCKTHKLNSSYYLIETFLAKKVFQIEMENLQDAADKYKLEIPENEANKLMEEYFNGDIRKLVESLQLSPDEGKCYLNTNKRLTH